MLRWRSASARGRPSDRAARRRTAGSLLTASPLLFGIPVAIGIAVSLIRLLGTAHPDLGWATTVNSDAEELYLGHTLYQDPAHGYTGQPYTPLFPTLISLLLHIHLWNGWSLLVVIGASLSLAALAARIAYLPTGSAPRVLRVLGAAGIGGIAYWCVSSVALPALDEGRSDHLAWAFALFGLVAVADFGPAPPRGRVVFAALLLTAALWTKQTTIGVAILALAWVLGLAAISALSRRRALLFAAVLGGVNLALLLVLNILSDGWEFYINFQMSSREWTRSLYPQFGFDGVRDSALAVTFIGVTWLASTAPAAASRRGRSLRTHTRAATGSVRRLLAAEDPTGRRALLLTLYLPLGYALAVYFMRKQGSDENHFVGVVWVLSLLAAAGWSVAQRHTATAMAAGGCVALFFVLAQLGPVRTIAAKATVMVPALEHTIIWLEVPSELRSWTRDHTLYAPIYSDLNVPQGGPLYPNYYNFSDLLASGVQPMYLVRALLDRRFDGVAPFPLDEEANLYTSSHGRWEENYMWKLNEVIAARYVARPGLPRFPSSPLGQPEYVLARRSGPEQAAWMRHCFGPFAAGGASFRIRRGGGFWCSFSPGRLRLVRTPAALSEVLTTQPVRAAGTLTVSLGERPPAHIDLLLGNEGAANWTARIASVPGSPRTLAISTYIGDTPLGSALVPATRLPGGQRGVKLNLTPVPDRPGPPLPAGLGATTLTAPAAKTTFALVATEGADIDLSAMRLGGS
jgi:hypothetical protein